ncbi:MAG: tyrosine-type recombinase/integrase [Pseudomonadota bacterium]|nr:tyrosine-type recombinase/integrase [Pseudomonadota bacterium]
MAQIKIPGLVGKTNKGGFTSWYWQPSKTLKDAGWRPIAFGQDLQRAMVGAQQRNAEVQEWKLGGKRPSGIRRKDPAGTFGALIQRYRREVLEGTNPDGSPRLAPATVKSYNSALTRLEEWAGKHPVAFITPARVKALKDAVARPVAKGGLGHAPAHALLKTLRIVMGFAERCDIIPRGSNPATAFDLGAPPSRKAVWSTEDDKAFDMAAYELGLPSMALARELALYTAQRAGDLIRFTEGQLVEMEIHELVLRQRLADAQDKVWGWVFSQRKTSTTDFDVMMEIPLEPTLLARVQDVIRNNRARDRAAGRMGHVHVLVSDEDGLPFAERRFIRTWKRILKKASEMTGRPQMLDLHWHDLRRTRVVRLRRRGMPKEMIAAITGHSLASINMMLKVYGPIDPTITAAAIASSLDEPLQGSPTKELSEKRA